MTAFGNYATPWQIGSPFYDASGALQYSDTTHNCGFGTDYNGDDYAYQTRTSYWRAWMFLYAVNLWSAIAAPKIFGVNGAATIVQNAGAIQF